MFLIVNIPGQSSMCFISVPSQPPTHVTGVVSPQAITVSWRKPSLPYLYGSLSGYKIIIHSINVQQGEYLHCKITLYVDFNQSFVACAKHIYTHIVECNLTVLGRF